MPGLSPPPMAGRLPFLPQIQRNEPAIRLVAGIFRSLGDETRIRILNLLSDQGEMNVTQLCTALKQSQPAVSHHLLQLKSSGLIDCRKEGKFNFYDLTTNGLHTLFVDLFAEQQNVCVGLAGLAIHVSRV